MRILALVATPPWPPRSGYQIRCWEILRRLAAGHDIALGVLVPRDLPPGAAWARPFRRVALAAGGRTTAATVARSLVARRPHHVLTHQSGALRRFVEEELHRGVDALYAHYLYFAPYLPPRAGGRPACVLDQHNVDHEVWDLYAAAERRPGAGAYLRRQARLVRDFEREHLADFDVILSVSERDREATSAIVGPDRRVVVAANGADVERLHPGLRHPAARPTVVFSGTDAPRNVAGVVWFLEECWPRVRERIPDARFVIAGRFARESLARRLRGAPGLELTGPLHDLGPALAEAHVAIVPVRLGGGTKLKAYEAFALGLPVVVTPESAAGLGGSDGEDLVVRDDPASYAAAVADLLLDEPRRERLGAAARRRTEAHHGWDAIATTIERELSSAALRGAST